MTKKILIVSKERGLAQFTSMELQKIEFLVDVVDDGTSGLTFLGERDYDLILVDFVLTDMTSKAFAEQLSLLKPASVLIVIADREEAEKHQEIIGQYAVAIAIRPLIMEELIDQIHRIFRGREFIDQHCQFIQTRTSFKDLRIDTENHTVFRGDEQILLTRREYDLLATLMSQGKPLTREQLLEQVWKYESATETNVVDVYIRYLRSKIDRPNQPSYIETVRGVGYAMQMV
ncbi:winged helix-turn-helix transcriptional regulator [Streptococcus moroccensis]|uniref:DNA-binding response OmpR family regulator n=1 Tax=Streptococcus moroccensis TaxID=1451356 RepID=A0ABT9YP94_9STRE|nr:response regulator transcription factor [Streptococcus moroccensis]MDQ0221554.1 DNA-binding response OmpR family regulator [Streptococcus moroccensis]